MAVLNATAKATATIAGSGSFQELVDRAVPHLRWCDVTIAAEVRSAIAYQAVRCDCGAQLYRDRVVGQYQELKIQVDELTRTIERYKTRSDN